MLTRLTHLSTFLNRPLSTSHIPAFPSTFLKLKTLSLIGGAVYTLAASQSSSLRTRNGELNYGVLVREVFEEGIDRVRGWNEGEIERRRRERREGRRRAEMERRERAEKERKGGIKVEGRGGFVLFRWGWRKPRG
ncbi:hypothetical protein L207DRAFT_561082 [Hyaloscypha variabilis F]|jgi:hypothetical protein|uniref:Uncharacterized protein n=1 Tax=Hyaloscypha variabilis (strain UAMH 11265 / GT02V1 / F) TaxID=1149755 RepID=A0A2J6SA29_HYAVF|nr:hypothetical protein L207DRAFT_561082 [Hyaloscypha variabilis F]